MPTKGSVLDELVGAISSTRNVAALKSQLGSQGAKKQKQKKKKLSAPLHRQERERVEANYAYKTSKDELRQWDPIVQDNRAAEQLNFPLNDPVTFYAEPLTERAKSFTPRTPLEKHIAETQGTSENVANIANDETLTEAEKEFLKAMNIKEAKKKTRQLQRIRKLQSYAAAKHAREAQIKSKKYHKVRKREKRKAMIKEIENLIEKDPEAAREKLKELDRDRAYERATLKHRSTSKYSVQLKNYASKNPGMQALMDEHLKLGRELQGKHGLEAALKSGDEDEESSDSDASGEKPLTRAEILELANEQAKRELNDEQTRAKKRIKKASENPELTARLQAIRKAVVESDVAKLTIPDEDLALATNENADLEHATNDEFLAEAFNADDVVGEFGAEKQKEAEKAPKYVDRRLFGWGDWTGPGIDEEAQLKRKEKFLKKLPQKPRKDEEMKKVMIREAENPIAEMQPRDVPFPFTTRRDFEAVVRQPLGRDWNTNIAHKSLTRRAITTKAGRIIRPIDRNETLLPTAEDALGVASD